MIYVCNIYIIYIYNTHIRAHAHTHTQRIKDIGKIYALCLCSKVKISQTFLTH